MESRYFLPAQAYSSTDTPPPHKARAIGPFLPITMPITISARAAKNDSRISSQ
jgi:hypothetical protein